MKIFQLLILVTLFHANLFCQQPVNPKWEISVDAGYANYTLSDNLLNYYTYKGNSFQNINAQIKYYTGPDILFGSAYYGQSTLSPNIDLSFYNYNNLKFIDASLSLGYLHKVYIVKSFFDMFIGASYNSQIVNKTDNFSSKLYENYLGYKDCSDITYANFSISALFRFVLNKNSLLFNPAFSIMNFSERTNNNFKGTYNKLYFINNYTGYQCSLAYTRNLSDHFDLKLQYSLQYKDYKYSTDSRILKKISSFGITYKF